jgi:RNA polymerase sigma-70 factor (ECF subfamily)
MIRTDGDFLIGNKASDEELIARFQQGDNYAFDQLVKRYKDPLLNFVFRFLGEREEAEDIVQETFLRLFKNKHYYQEVARFSTWIYTIAGNLAKTELRRRKRRRLFSINQPAVGEKEIELADDSDTPEEVTNTQITDAIIQKSIDRLTVKFKQVIILRDVQGFSYEEIAEIAKIPLGTVKSRVNRARIKLQEDLQHLMQDLK